MRRFALIFDLDGRPVDRVSLQAMLRAATAGRETGERVWIDGPIGLACCENPYRSTSRPMPQPSAEDLDAAVFDGRIDNRGDLVRELVGRGVTLRRGTDEELVEQLCLAWGRACAGRILGDFAFAAWDSSHRRLLCARDILGLRSLFYCRAGRVFYAASEIRQLLAAPGVERRPNEGMVGEYLAERITDVSETLFEGIHRLPPAHTLEVTPEGLSLHRYWDVDLHGDLVLADDAAYAERLRELLTEAVRCRVHDCSVVGAQLSGGLDSTGVVGIARSLQRATALSVFELLCFATVYPGFPRADESGHIEAAARFLGLRPHLTSARRPTRSDCAEWAARWLDFPPYPGDLSSDPLFEQARDMGCNVMLTGNGGDEWFWGFESVGASLVKRLRSATTATALVAAARTLVWRELARLAPFGLDRVARRVRHRRRACSWIPGGFRRRTALDDRLTRFDPRRRDGGSARALMASALIDGSIVHGREVAERYARGFGIEERHPLHDRRIIEFAHAVPLGQLLRDGCHKHVLRGALEGVVPDSTRTRHDKAEFTHLILEALLEPTIADSLRDLRIADRGWVAADRVASMLDEVVARREAGHAADPALLWPLWMVFGIETWYREAFPGDVRIC